MFQVCRIKSNWFDMVSRNKNNTYTNWMDKGLYVISTIVQV